MWNNRGFEEGIYISKDITVLLTIKFSGKCEICGKEDDNLLRCRVTDKGNILLCENCIGIPSDLPLPPKRNGRFIKQCSVCGKVHPISKRKCNCGCKEFTNFSVSDD